MDRLTRKQGVMLMALGAAATLAGCAPPPQPLPPLPPPPPVVVVIPPKPKPPAGASAGLVIPPADASGLRISVNRNISPAQMVWNLRSAYNVAALNCRGAEHADILVNYRAFLKSNAKTLTRYNTAVDAEFKGKYGARYIAPRETYMTGVYNHFALPPTMSNFCTAVQAVVRDGMAVKSKDLAAFAARSLPSIEVVFDDFYRRYEAYQAELAAWQAKYAPVTAGGAATSALYGPTGGTNP